MDNIHRETGTKFCEACESGDISKAKRLLKDVSLSSFKEWRTLEGRTCLHAAVLAGDPDLVGELKELIRKRDNQGDTALHLAVRMYREDLVKQLLDLDLDLDSGGDLCDCRNNKEESPLNMAIRLQFLEAVGLLITRTQSALQEKNGFLLPWLVSLNQVGLVKLLIDQNVDLSEHINQLYEPPAKENTCDEEGDGATKPNVRDAPLHIAARNKYEQMVNLLLKVPGVNKHICNSEGKTPLDIAREVTEYYDSFRIIKYLRKDPPRRKKFMYCVPQVSHKKHKNARDMVNKAFDERCSAELVVAVLLATMTFTAAFTVPGGFREEAEEEKELGSPVLIVFMSFKLFLIFDFIAFFLSLFVCIMWQMASELTVTEKMWFMTLTSLVISCSFCFTTLGFMAALYSVLAHKVKTFAWVVFGILIAIAAFGIYAFFYQSARFAVTRARFHRLCGNKYRADDFIIWVWETLEPSGFLDVLRSYKIWIRENLPF